MQSAADISVIAAVWHQQRDKLDLLRGHMENLARQSVPVHPIYVFDGGDSPPDWLVGHTICSSAQLTLYEAWNLALAATRTPFVANLNLDDRFATDALSQMAHRLKSDTEVYLVGGDWLVCHSQQETDAVGQVRDLVGIEMFSIWPPPPSHRNRRLGVGDGKNTGSMGPACLWRLEAHMSLPRYPYRFADGSLIHIIGDWIWWSLIQRRLGKKLARLPAIIGHYRTWPESQAEFRFSTATEHANTAISLL